MIHQSPIAKSSTSTMDEDHIFEAITHRISSMITEPLGNPRYAASVSATVAGGQQVR
jgi:hypothetical protein